MKKFIAELGRLLQSEKQFARHLALVGERQQAEYEIARGCHLFVQWSQLHQSHLHALLKRLGGGPVIPERAEAARPPAAANGSLLNDLEEGLILAHQSHIQWTVISQGAKTLGDAELNSHVQLALSHMQREIPWFESQLKNAAPQILLTSS